MGKPFKICYKLPDTCKTCWKKIEQKRRERAYSYNWTNESPIQIPFTEIWPNNHPLVIFSALKVPLNKNQGGYWGKELPKVPLVIVPFDIVNKHKERWQYLNRIRISELDPVYLLSSSKIPTTCLSCIRTKCTYDRFPYFPYFPYLLEVMRRLLKSNWMFFFK